MSFRITRYKLDVVIIAACLLFSIRIFILLKEASKLVVIFKLLIFHWHNLPDMHLKVCKVFHENLLLFNERVDVYVVLGYLILRNIPIRYPNVVLIKS